MRRVLGAAAIGCGIALFARADGGVLPDSGPLSAVAMQRLTLLDAQRVGARIVAVGDRGYIVISEDGGASWRRAKAPAEPMLTSVDFLDARRGLAVGHDSVILLTRDGGDTGTQQFSAPAEQRPLLDVLFAKPDLAVAVGAYGAYYESSDEGKTWTARKVIADDKHLNSVVALGDGRMLIFGEAGTILSSSDWGKTWTPQPSPYKGSLFGSLVASDGAVIAFGMRGNIYRSADKGKSWQQVDDPAGATLIAGDKLPDNSIVLAGSAGTALVSRDDGKTFQPLDTRSTRAFSKAVAAGDASILLLGEGGPRLVPLAPRR